jgi:hypothetical protein
MTGPIKIRPRPHVPRSIVDRVEFVALVEERVPGLAQRDTAKRPEPAPPPDLLPQARPGRPPEG